MVFNPFKLRGSDVLMASRITYGCALDSMTIYSLLMRSLATLTITHEPPESTQRYADSNNNKNPYSTEANTEPYPSGRHKLRRAKSILIHRFVGRACDLCSCLRQPSNRQSQLVGLFQGIEKRGLYPRWVPTLVFGSRLSSFSRSTNYSRNLESASLF